MNANNIDNTIDRALSALRDAAPRPGLEGRILASLEHRAITRATEPGGLPFHKPGSPASLLAGVGGSARESSACIARIALWTAASAAVVAIALLIMHHHRATAAQFANATTPSGVAAAFSPLNTSAQKTVALAPDGLAAGFSPLNTRAKIRGALAPVCSDHHSTGCPIHNDNVVMNGITPTDAQLFADLHAPSHPAPPLPLTPQEKLFLSRLRYGNATQLAELDPIVRATHDDAATAAFKAFFPDPPPLKQSGDPDDSN